MGRIGGISAATGWFIGTTSGVTSAADYEHGLVTTGGGGVCAAAGSGRRTASAAAAAAAAAVLLVRIGDCSVQHISRTIDVLDISFVYVFDMLSFSCFDSAS